MDVSPLFPLAAALGLLPVPLEPPVREAGRYQVWLRLPAGGLAAGEEMEVEFRIVRVDSGDPEPTPLLRARVEAEIDMPAMPGMPRFTETAHAEGIPGVYGIHPTFAHGGEYRLRLTLPPSASGGGAPVAEFPLEVKDAVPATSGSDALPWRRPFRLDVVALPSPPRAGQPVELRLSVRRETPAESGPMTAFELSHEKPMHLFLVRSDLGEFVHEHPDLEEGGVFRLRHSFPTGGLYRLFADVAPAGAGTQVLVAELTVEGPGGRPFALHEAYRKGGVLDACVDGVCIRLEPPSFPIPVGRTERVAALLRDAHGEGVRPDPWLGALGHLLLVHHDGRTFAHAHPDELAPGADGGRLVFLTRLPKPGLYRAWLQFRRGERISTAEFVLSGAPRPRVSP